MVLNPAYFINDSSYDLRGGDMSIWSGIKAVLGVGGDGQSNVMKAASGIGGWIDGKTFTDQEKAEHNAAMIPHFNKFMENTVNENSERSRTRRDIAIWIIRAEIIFLSLSAITYKIDAPLAEYIYKIATESPMGYLTLGVGAFFFGAHLVRQVKGS